MLFTEAFCLPKTRILLMSFVLIHCIASISFKAPMKFYVYSVLIQEIKELIMQLNVTVCHILREGNRCADFMTKLEASSNIEFLMILLPMICDIFARLMRLEPSFLEISCFFFLVLFFLLFLFFISLQNYYIITIITSQPWSWKHVVAGSILDIPNSDQTKLPYNHFIFFIFFTFFSFLHQSNKV